MVFRKLRAILSGSEPEDRPSSSAPRPSPRSFKDMLSSSGRVSYTRLKEIAREFPEESFVAFVRYPVLAGSAVKAGTIMQRETRGFARNMTLRFKSADMQNILSGKELDNDEQPLQHALYALWKDSTGRGGTTVFTIGRTPGNDIVMPDFAISEHHARIEREGDSYYLLDAGSTNGTTVNGAALGGEAIHLGDGDVIAFARYEFTFIHPGSLYFLLRK